MVSYNLLQAVRFMDLNKWSANHSLFEKITAIYPLAPLSKVLKRIKETITVEDEKTYKRITVRLYGQGVLKRDELFGKDIGTKKQFIAREGQLIISRIDARNGAFGIVTKELDGAIVTNDFWLFDVKNALPQYVMLILSSEKFQHYWQTQSSGTTNRQRIDETSFLSSRIALPSPSTQRILLDRYFDTLNNIPAIERHIQALIESKDNIWCKSLSIEPFKIERQRVKLFSTIKFSRMYTWSNNTAVPKNFYSNSPFKVVKIEQICKVNSGGTPSRSNPEYYSGNIPWVKTAEVKDSIIFDTEEKITETALKNSSARLYPKESIIIAMYGHTRGKTALLGIPATTNQACAVLHDLKTSSILPEYLWLYMQSQFERIRTLAVGSAQPNLNAQMIKSYPLILPPISSKNPCDITQENIVKKVNKINEEIRECTAKIEKLKKQARLNFEEAVFGETQEVKN